MYAINNIYESQYISKTIYIKSYISDFLNVSCGYLIRYVESIKISSQAQNYKNHVAIKSHYPDSPVNLSFRTIDYTLVLRITITNESLGELSKVYMTFGQVTQLLAMTPSSGNMDIPLQWKLGG